MRIDVMNTVMGVGVGVGDELLEWMDRKAIEDDAASTRGHPFKGFTDWGRVAIAGACFLGQAMNVMPREAATILQSELPLVTKSVSRAIRNAGETLEPGSNPARHVTYSEPVSIRKGVGWRPKIID